MSIFQHPIQKLAQLDEPFRFSAERNNLFFESMRKSFIYHYENNKVYKKLCYLEGFSPRLFLDYDDIFHIPHIFAPTSFKIPQTCPEPQMTQDTQIDFRRKVTADVFKDLGILKPESRTNFMFLDAHEESSAMLKLVAGERSFSEPEVEKHNNIFHISFTNENSNTAPEKIADIIIESVSSNIPVVISGSKKTLHQYCTDFPQQKFVLPEESFIITLFDKNNKIEKTDEEFKKILSGKFSLSPENIRYFVDFPEHGVPYCQCEAGRFHLPVYSRVAARNPETLRTLTDGITGILHFYSPFPINLPLLSFLTPHTGFTEKNCVCGRNAPYVEFVNPVH
jgi:hypothetical protein